MVYDMKFGDYKWYLEVRQAPKGLISAFPKDQIVKNHPDMKTSEWAVLNSAAQIKNYGMK